MTCAGLPKDVLAICVTYGERWQLVKETLRAIASQGVAGIILVDNGTPYDAAALAESSFPGIVEGIRLERNTGSAGGFSTGLTRALERQPRWIMLLDDDNAMASDCLQKLLDAPLPLDDARLALRPKHQKALLESGTPANAFHRPGAFLGFHYIDIPAKILSRLWRRPAMRPETFITCPQAPYSGLLLPSMLIEAVGLPRKDFVLYSDDSEWTSRIPRCGKSIHLVPDAVIMDLDTSWHLSGKSRSSLGTWLHEGSDLRAFYACRNQIAFERIRDGDRRIDNVINKMLYVTALAFVAILGNRVARFSLLLRAIRHGLSGRLGEHPEHRLT